MTTAEILTIVVALIVGVASPIASIIVNNKQQNVKEEVRAQQLNDAINVLRADIGRLEKKQDLYNHLKDRVFTLEKDIEVIKCEINNLQK